MLLSVPIWVVVILIQTFVLGLSLYLVSPSTTSPFREDGFITTWVKCLALVVVIFFVGTYLPYAPVVTVIIFFVGIMGLFQRTLFQTLLVSLANWVLTNLVHWGIPLLLEKFGAGQ